MLGDPYEMGPQVESALDDKIMICDDCGVHAHRTCFGGADFVIPEGPWRCPTCQFDCQPISTQTTALKCFLCARTSTDLVSTRLSVNWETARRRWVHIVCWMATAKQVGNDVIGYRYPNKLERGVVIDVKALQDSLKRASPPRQCQLCESQSGHLLDCSHPGCDQALHASCVVQAACENWLHSSKEDVCTLKGVTCSHVFCREHSEENWARQTPEDFDRRVTELFGEPDPDSEPDSEPAHEVNPARVTTPRVRSKRLETATVRVLPQRTAPNCIPSDFDLNSPFDGAIRRGEDPELDMLEEDLQHGSLRTEVLTLVERRMQEHEEEIQQLKCKVQELQAKIDGRGKRPRKRPIPASKRPRTTR
eukprot:TRINITY_DN6004_c0_g2_i2.p1 TRINITY_DN6004_c0_g2~~TRINITY_DN6004_c0_g2_i2.p1  ORF type:complete len:363 (-),score=1.18 TRINITY_DN6004_c0_g2_i2:111-1199(-)